MDLSDWDLAFGAVSAHGPAQSPMNHAPDSVEGDRHPFNCAEVERLLSYRAAVQAGFYNDSCGGRKSVN